MTTIELKNARTKNPDWAMAQPVDFTLCKDEHIAIVGRNGAGKSMLVDMITGRHPVFPNQVAYHFDGEGLISEHIRYIAFRDTYGGDNDRTYFLQQRWVLSGQNGAGKSTLLSLVCADNPQGYACDITLFGHRRGSGESIWDVKRHIGYVSPEMHRSYQRELPALRIVASGLKDSVGLYIRATEDELAVCRWWMHVFGIEHLADRSFIRMSSGEQRLVLLARAFVKDPELLILDEPLHGLDNMNRRLVKDIIETFCERPNKTLIFVSHYKEECPACIDHDIYLKRH